MNPDPPWSDTVKLNRSPGPEPALGTDEFATGLPPDGAAAITVSVKAALPVPPLLVALMVMLEVPEAVGVPEIKPVLVLS